MTAKIFKRALSPKFFESFKNGKLKKLLEIIKKDNDLIMCLRGHSGYTTIYYKSLQILKIYQSKFEVHKNYGICFDKLGVNNVKESNNIIIFRPPLNFDWNDYFKEAKQKIDIHCQKAIKLEKETQQKMFCCNNCDITAIQNNYTVFDIEYCFIPNVEKKSRVTARFDALALTSAKNTETNKTETKLAIIELKVGLGAISGNASLSKHYNDVKNFIENVKINKFIKDMEEVVFQMSDLGLINKNNNNLGHNYIDKNNIQFICVLDNYNENSILLQQEINNMGINNSDKFKTFFKLFVNNEYKLEGHNLFNKDEIVKFLSKEKVRCLN